jgi:hypothetical protein
MAKTWRRLPPKTRLRLVVFASVVDSVAMQNSTTFVWMTFAWMQYHLFQIGSWP